MPTKTRTARTANRFESRLAKGMASSFNAPLSHSAKRRKTSQQNNQISYYEGEPDSEDGYGSDTIVVDWEHWQKKKVIVLDDDSDDEIPLAKLSVAKQDEPAGKLFRGLPTEIHQHIADFLPDSDICNYARVCEVTRASITDIVWKKRFDRTFDDVPGAAIHDVVRKYAYRRDVSKKWTCFDLGKHGGLIDAQTREVQKKQQKDYLDMLRSLILESNARKTYDDRGNKSIHGLNLQFICDLITGGNGRSYVDIIDAVFSTDFDKDMNKLSDMSRIVSASVAGTLIYAIQLCLTPISLSPRFCNSKVSHFDISQFQAYDTPGRQPIFAGRWKQDANLRWLLHVVNFFKYHLTAGDEGLLAHHYKDLEEDQYPQPWEGRIEPGTRPLKSHWKGAYTYMDPTTMASLRMGNGNGKKSNIHTDDLDWGEAFQDMTFFFDEDKSQPFEWPEKWEQIVCSDPFLQLNNRQSKRASPRTKTKEVKKPQVKQFWGTCRGKNGHFFGRLHAMTPQQGIHGFQRLTMIKFYTKRENDEEVYDPNQVWAFEGCVLPGARIVVGRWWDSLSNPNDIGTVSGPFLWWNVDRSAATVPIRKEEAFEFLDSVVDPELGII